MPSAGMGEGGITDMRVAAVEAAAVEAAKVIDENRRRPSSAIQISLQDGDVERQRCSFQLRSFQGHDRIAYIRSIAAEHRDRRIRGVDGKVVLAFIPLHDELLGGDMPRGPDRPVGEYNRILGYARQDQFAALQLGAIRVDDGERWHWTGRSDLADGLFERHMRLLGSVLGYCPGGCQGQASSKSHKAGDAGPIHCSCPSRCRL